MCFENVLEESKTRMLAIIIIDKSCIQVIVC